MIEKGVLDYRVAEVSDGKADLCRAILADLPEWFGIPAATAAYVAAADSLPMLAAYDPTGTPVGFVSLKHQTVAAIEAYVLGVARGWHRRGIGRALFASAEAMAAQGGARYLTVKTLAANNPDPHYKATRLFYEVIGFEPVEVFPTLWDEHNPCLLMIKKIG